MNTTSALIFILILISTISCTKKTEKRVVRIYYANSKMLQKVYEVNKDSVADGYFKTFNKSGGKLFDCNYKSGKLSGKQLKYWPNGKVEQLTYYTNDMLDSGKYFDSSGNFTRNVYETIFKSASDTVKIGQLYSVKVMLTPLRNIDSGTIDIYLNNDKVYESGNAYVGKPLVHDSFKGTYVFEKTFSDTGEYVINCAIHFEEKDKQKNFSGMIHNVWVK